MDTLISVRDMYKIYNPGENEVRALDGVSLDIEEGEFVAIVGHSGSGKSTLMNMLGCLDVPTEGTYVLNGRDVSSLTDNELSEVRNLDIGFIFQGFNLIPNLNALENVELPLIYRNVEKSKRRELAKAALEKVGLGNRMKHKPSEMSGGQQQRVAIARAIAATPPLILADEPTGNLDSKSTKDIMKILNSLNEQGNTIVLITHDDGIAENAKRVVRIMDGKIESDTKKQLFNEADYYERDIECVDVELYEGEVADVHDEGIEFVEVSGFVNNEMS
ncbi:MAG: ABC transporter ATP-binding protein [Lachnospiraceae bacterium]|nr:ABC transporter ATP-binding protein [Lachnospiraceae bacterium]